MARNGKTQEQQPAAQEHVDRKQAEGADKTPLDTVQVTNNQLAHWFTYHKPDDEQVQQIQRIRKAGAAMAQIIKDNTPNGADQSAAIRKVREAVMTANAAVVCRGR